jgi:hypothetical protein
MPASAHQGVCKAVIIVEMSDYAASGPSFKKETGFIPLAQGAVCVEEERCTCCGRLWTCATLKSSLERSYGI